MTLQVGGKAKLDSIFSVLIQKVHYPPDILSPNFVPYNRDLIKVDVLEIESGTNFTVDAYRLKPIKEDAPMKYEVTREQQEAIDIFKEDKNDVEKVINGAYKRDYVNIGKPLNGLDPRLIIAMWDGEAEVKADPVSYLDAVQALVDGKTVLIIDYGKTRHELNRNQSDFGDYWHWMNPKLSEKDEHKYYIIEDK